MKTILKMMITSALLAVASISVASESVLNLADQLMDRSSAAYKVVGKVSEDYSVRGGLLTAASELGSLATSLRYGHPDNKPEPSEIFEKLKTIKTINADLLEMAEDNDDLEAISQSKKIRRLVIRMLDLTERLNDTIDDDDTDE